VSSPEQPAPRRFPRSTPAEPGDAVVGWAPALVGLAPQPMVLVWVPVYVWFI
jgi:hypothetical protein